VTSHQRAATDAASAAEVLRALELAPNDAWIWNSLGDHYRFVGEFAKGIAAKQRAWELDPLSPVSQWDLSYANLVAGHFDEALHWSEVSVGLAPHNLDSYSPGIMAACLAGRTELMRKLVTAARQNVHENEGLLLLLEARTAIQEKKPEEARRLLAKTTPLAETGDTTPAYIGYCYLLLGDADQAATWLQRAYEQRDSTIVWNELIDLDLIAANPKTRPILDRPGLKELYELRQRHARASAGKS
jgi:tetratricopeptide (TPR) repeat protein